jgi:hypothetical protein
MESILDGSNFQLKAVAQYKVGGIEYFTTDNMYKALAQPIENPVKIETRPLAYIHAETPSRSIGKYQFSTKCGSSMDIKSSKTL